MLLPCNQDLETVAVARVAGGITRAWRPRSLPHVVARWLQSDGSARHLWLSIVADLLYFARLRCLVNSLCGGSLSGWSYSWRHDNVWMWICTPQYVTTIKLACLV